MFCFAVSGLFLVMAINSENYTDFMEACKLFSCNKRLRVVFGLGFGCFFLVKGATRMLTEQPKMSSTEALCEVKGHSELEFV